MAIQSLGPSVAPAAPVREKTAAKPVAQPDARTVTEAAPEVAEKTAATQPSRAQVDQAMNEVRRAIAPMARNLQFSIYEGTGRTVIKVVDASTQEVIRQIPSEELLALSESLGRQSGVFIRQKA